MRHWTEAVLALAIVAALFWGFMIFAPEREPGHDPGGNNQTIEVDPEAASRGGVVAEAQGCLVCHSTDGSLVSAPTFKALAGSSRPLTSGEFVRADEEYLRNSIIDPSSQIVEGYDDVMPDNFGEILSEDEINDLVAFIKSLD